MRIVEQVKLVESKTDSFPHFVQVIHIQWVGDLNLVGSQTLLDG
jgi:hypothetical protein